MIRSLLNLAGGPPGSVVADPGPSRTHLLPPHLVQIQIRLLFQDRESLASLHRAEHPGQHRPSLSKVR